MNTENLTDLLTISGSVPGALVLNIATTVGYRIAGTLGAIVALIGVLIPTFLIILGLSIFYLNFKHNPILESVFEGIRPAIVALIGFAGYRIGKISVVDKTTLIITCIAVSLLLFFAFHPVILIICGAICGMILFIFTETKRKKEKCRGGGKSKE